MSLVTTYSPNAVNFFPTGYRSPPTPQSTPASAEYEVYYEDYPDEPTFMYNPYNNAQGQYYSNQGQNIPARPNQYYAVNDPREPFNGHRPSHVNSDRTEVSFQPQEDSLMVETNKKGGVQYQQNFYHTHEPARIVPEPVSTTTTEKVVQTPSTTTTTEPPRPKPKIDFKPSQVDNFFISAEQILNEPGSLTILQNGPDKDESNEAPLPNILPQFRPNANVDSSERLPLFGDEEKKVTPTSFENSTGFNVPQGPVEIPQQSIEEYEVEEEVKTNGTYLPGMPNQEIMGMLPPAPHPPHQPYQKRPSLASSFLSTLFYGNKRGPPVPPHVMIGYGNDTLRPWGYPQPHPGHKFPPGQFPPSHGQHHNPQFG